ncbi:MAG: hypothetical protein ACXVZX_14435, partial [Terriglobales bacterium]
EGLAPPKNLLRDFSSPRALTYKSERHCLLMPVSVSSIRKSAFRVATLLFLFVNFLYLLTSTGRVHTIDEISSVIQAESLTLHANTAVPQAVGSKVYYGKIGRDGLPHSAYPPGHSLAAVPWYALGHFVIAKLPGVSPEINDIVVSLTCTWSSATFAALAVTFVFLLANSLGVSERDSLITALVVAAATPLFVYSGWFFSEPLTTACWLAAAYALFGTAGNEPISVRHALIAGLLLGFTLFIRATNVLAPFVFTAGMIARDRRRAVKPVVALCAVVGAFGVMFLLRNLQLYGNILDFGYPKYAEAGRETASFDIPWHVGLFAFLFSPGKSILLFCPPVVLAIASLPRLWKRNRGLAIVCAFLPLVYLLLFAHYSSFEGSYSYGPRYMVPSLVLLCVALAAWFTHRPRWFGKALAALFIAGLLVQLIGLSTNVMEDMVNNHYYDPRYFYQMGYSPISGQLHLIAKYITGVPAPLGMGFDRWFLFAAKAGMPAWIIGSLLTIMIAGLAFSGWKLLGAVRDSA